MSIEDGRRYLYGDGLAAGDEVFVNNPCPVGLPEILTLAPTSPSCRLLEKDLHVPRFFLYLTDDSQRLECWSFLGSILQPLRRK